MSKSPIGRVTRRAALVLATALATSPLAAQPTPARIAVVDLDFIVANSTAGKALQQKLEAFQQQVQGELDTMTRKAQEIRQRAAEGAGTLTQNQLAELERQFEDQSNAIRRFRDDKQREGQKMQEAGLRDIEAQLKPVFEKVRDEGGYDLILNNVPGVVVMASERIDLTQQIVARLNAGG